MTNAVLAMDRDSARRIDIDGRLHVELTPISKANICEYFGNEIPGAEALGLDPGTRYSLFRDPAELAKAAYTFNNVPVLFRHPTNEEGALTAENPLTELIVGSTGTDGAFNEPFLENSMVIWKDTSIEGVLSNRKKQLSAGYRYKAVMEPGEYLGAKYHGRMTDIIGNHVALVIDGRVGADVLVGDSLPLEMRDVSKEISMPNAATATSRKALLARGALAAYLRPKLAKDAKIDLKAALLGTTAANWTSAKPVVAQRVIDAAAGKLGKDAKLDDMHAFLDSLDREGEGEPDAIEAETASANDEDDDDVEAMDASEAETENAARAKERAEKMEAKDRRTARDARRAARDAKRAADKKAMDAETPEQKAERERMEARGNDNEPKPVTKAAMDAALEYQAVTMRQEMRDATRALREAEDIVRPVVGVLIAQDSAEAVYGVLFAQQGVDTTGVHPTAFKALAQQTVRAAQAMKTQDPAPLAMDSSGAAAFAAKFPGVAAVRVI